MGGKPYFSNFVNNYSKKTQKIRLFLFFAPLYDVKTVVIHSSLPMKTEFLAKSYPQFFKLIHNLIKMY
ncbi:hypothetical protein Dip518_000283 [Parelusimicrobium proximum]